MNLNISVLRATRTDLVPTYEDEDHDADDQDHGRDNTKTSTPMINILVAVAFRKGAPAQRSSEPGPASLPCAGKSPTCNKPCGLQ